MGHCWKGIPTLLLPFLREGNDMMLLDKNWKGMIRISCCWKMIQIRRCWKWILEGTGRCCWKWMQLLEEKEDPYFAEWRLEGMDFDTVAGRGSGGCWN